MGGGQTAEPYPCKKKNLSKDVKKELIKGKRKKLCMFIIYSKRKLEFRKLILMNLLFKYRLIKL